jgi:hypothetical protein
MDLLSLSGTKKTLMEKSKVLYFPASLLKYYCFGCALDSRTLGFGGVEEFRARKRGEGPTRLRAEQPIGRWKSTNLVAVPCVTNVFVFYHLRIHVLYLASVFFFSHPNTKSRMRTDRLVLR